jgi:small subunit ribosomal protein S15
MSVTNEVKKDLIEKFGKNPEDTGSVQAQIAILTERIKALTLHFETNPKDHSSRRGLFKLVSRRRHLLDYLKKKDEAAYQTLIGELSIRK